MTAQEAYILAKAYTNKSIEGAGSLKGAACQIKSIEAITGGHRITFEWEDNDGEVSTDTMDVMDGADGNDGVGISSITYKETDAHGNYVYTVTLTDTNTYDIICPKGAQGETGATGATGNGIASIVKTSTAGLVDTYTITYTNGQTTTFTVTNGESITMDSAMSDSSTNPVQNKVITEALADKQDATDSNLQTTADTIVGAINEHEGDIGSLKSGFTALDNEVNGSATTYPFADVITINDAVPANLADCSVKVEPVQDLHGYDKPWVGGAGLNKYSVLIGADGFDNNSGATHSNDNGTLVINCNSTHFSGVYTNINAVLRGLIGDYTGDISYSFDVKASKENTNVRIGFDSAGTREETIGTSWQRWTTTATADGTDKHFIAYNNSNEDVEVQIKNFMFETGSVAHDYQPYTNVCPISGHTEAVVARIGKNLLDLSDCSKESGTVTINDGLVKINGTFSGKTVLLGDFTNIQQLNKLIGKQLTFSKTNIKGNSNVTIFFSGDGAWYYWMIQSDNKKTLTLDRKLSNLVLYLDGTFDLEFYLQVELGADATTYAPYKGQQYTLALGDTIYGGMVDFDSGVMTVDRAIMTIDENTPYEKSTQNAGIQYAYNNILTGNKNRTPISNEFTINANISTWDSMVDNQIMVHPSEFSTFRVRKDDCDTDAKWVAFLTNNPLQVCYELATPFTVQLTPQQIQLLQGTNTLYASTGDISVTVNGVSGSIGAVQTAVNELTEDVAVLDSLITNDFVTVATGFYCEDAYKAKYTAISNGTHGIVQINGVVKTSNALTASTDYTICSVPFNSIREAFGIEFNESGTIFIDKDSGDVVYTPSASVAQYTPVKFNIAFCF